MKRLLIITSLALALAACGGPERPNMFKDFADKEALCLAYEVYPDAIVKTARADHDYDEYNTDQIRHDLAEVCK